MVNKKKLNKLELSLIVVWFLSILACYPVFSDERNYDFRDFCDEFWVYLLSYAFLTLIIYILLAAIIIITLGRDRCINAIVKYFITK